MRSLLALALSLGVSAITVFIQSPATSAPPEQKEAAAKLLPGAYLWNGNAWTPMEAIKVSGGGAKHMGKMLVPGLTPQMVWTFRDASAPVHLDNGKPVFCVKFYSLPQGSPYAPSGRDIVIVRFDEKKDHRELQTTSGGNLFTFKAGLSKDRMPDIEITSLDAGTHIVTLKDALRPGEYLLSTSSLGTSGYDFGFHPPKR
jgi:hypothetical protein